jgi:hypothetical protein
MKRIAVILSAVIALITVSVTLGGAAWSATNTPTTAVITFNDAAHNVQLTIPTPACPTSQPDCQWKFFLNEPKLNVDVATVYGTSGTLTLDYPPEFCGVIQADAYVGPPWVAKRGFQHTIDDCNPPNTTTTTTTTTTTVPPTTTTTTTRPPTPPTTTTTTTTRPPTPPTTTTTTTTTLPVAGPVAGTSTPPPGPPAALPFTATPAAPVAAAPVAAAPVAAAPVAAAPAELPFTGVNTKPLWFIGIGLVALGLALTRSNDSWRRMRRRVSMTLRGYMPELVLTLRF